MARKATRLEDLTGKDFTGPDRINSWRITQEDLDRIVSNLKKISETPTVIDVGCGYGLMSYLLAKEGCYVIGIDKPIEGDDEKSRELRKQRNEHWKFLRSQKSGNLELIEGNFGELYETPKFIQADAVYCSWMPLGKNWSMIFYQKIKAPMILHVIGETKERDIDDNEYEDEEGKTVTGHILLGPQNQELFKRFGSPYQISRYADYEVLDAWMVSDYRTGSEGDSLKLSKIRADIRKDLNTE